MNNAPVRSLALTGSEKVLYHQIHPAKLGTDICAAIISLYFFWQHRLWIGLVLHFVPPVIASMLVISLASLENQKNSAFGAYVERMMTRKIEALRFGGDILMVFAAWWHSVALMAVSLLIIISAWLSGLRT